MDPGPNQLPLVDKVMAPIGDPPTTTFLNKYVF